MDNSNGLLLIVQLLCSNIRHLRFSQSKVISLMLLVRLGLLCSQELVLRRIIPFIVISLEDHYAVVRACAIRSLRILLNSITVVPAAESNIFETYLFPALNTVAKDSEVLVRIAFAESLSVIAESAKRFLDTEHFMLQMKVVNNTSNDANGADSASGSTSSSNVGGGSSNSLLVENIFDKKLRVLHDHVSRWINDLVLDVGFVSTAGGGDYHRKLNAGHYLSQHCALVKRALLEDIVRLFVFFGAEESSVGLLAQLLTYLNDAVRVNFNLFFSDILVCLCRIGNYDVLFVLRFLQYVPFLDLKLLQSVFYRVLKMHLLMYRRLLLLQLLKAYGHLWI